MSGKELKQKIQELGISYASLAEKLGLNGDQALHQLFRANDVKSGLIKSIALVTNMPICWFYDTMCETNGATTPDNKDLLEVIKSQQELIKNQQLAISSQQLSIDKLTEAIVNLSSNKRHE